MKKQGTHSQINDKSQFINYKDTQTLSGNIKIKKISIWNQTEDIPSNLSKIYFINLNHATSQKLCPTMFLHHTSHPHKKIGEKGRDFSSLG